MITVATWNVLHRIHAENWAEEVPGRWPDEAARIAAITATIAKRSEQVIALQEVSGDHLESLRALPRTIFAFRYPRVPRPKHGPSPLRAPEEYLVTLVDGEAGEVAAESSAADGGKGLLAIDIGGLIIVNTHVSFGPPRVAQLARIAEVSPTIILGDFNADRDTVLANLPGFTAALLDRPTRPRTGSSKSSTIDHVLVVGGTLHDAMVIDAGGLSDHHLVTARIEPRHRRAG